MPRIYSIPLAFATVSPLGPARIPDCFQKGPKRISSINPAYKILAVTCDSSFVHALVKNTVTTSGGGGGGGGGSGVFGGAATSGFHSHHSASGLFYLQYSLSSGKVEQESAIPSNQRSAFHR